MTGTPDEYWVPLGYTIYRTDYSDGTEDAWLTLVAAIKDRIKEDIAQIVGDFG